MNGLLLRRRNALGFAVGFLLLVGVTAFSWRAYNSDAAAAAAERDAFEYVRIHGFTSEGYTASLLTNLVVHFSPPPSQTRIGTTPLVTVSFPADRMTDSMAAHLVNIRRLHRIVLYPPDPGYQGVDFGATKSTLRTSLANPNLPLSADSVSVIERKFPKLEIQVLSRPKPNSTPAVSPNAG
ncbi:MAG: hypothetical protein WBC44_18960 [Planctomycetaceae bacterium]